jgi:hypothetical protein
MSSGAIAVTLEMSVSVSPGLGLATTAHEAPVHCSIRRQRINCGKAMANA